jgi:hypothetical protein
MRGDRRFITSLKPGWLAGTIAALPLMFSFAYAADGGVADLDRGSSRSTARQRNNDSNGVAGLDNSGSTDRSTSYSRRWRDYNHSNYRNDDWDNSAGRLVIEFGRDDSYYFPSFVDAFAHLDSRDEWPRYDRMSVLDFATYNSRDERLIDADEAYYLVGADWGSSLYGNLPVLAFSSRRDARRFQGELGGTITDIGGLIDISFDWRWGNSNRDRDRWDRWYQDDYCSYDWVRHGDHYHQIDNWHDDHHWRDNDRHDRGRHRGRGRGRGRH